MSLELNKRARTKNTKAYLLIAIGLVLIFGFPYQRQASIPIGTSDISRLLPTGLSPGDTATVTLDVAVGAETECSFGEEAICNDFYILEELPPTGVVPTNLNNPVCSVQSGPRITCVVLENAKDTLITYDFVVPNTASLTFQGQYIFQGDTVSHTINGDTVMTVQTSTTTNPPPSGDCTPDWDCDPWTDYPNTKDQCGDRTRYCVDLNNCNDNTGKPATLDTTACPKGNTTSTLTLTAIGIAVLLIGVFILLSRRKKR